MTKIKLTEPSSRIKMIAATEQLSYPDDYTSELRTYLSRAPTVFALTYDDRIFVYDTDEGKWLELPELPI